MALNLLQTPASASLAQSPIIFSVLENTAVINNPDFQYNANLYYWDGSPAVSGGVDYQLVKYPNEAGAGIFDFSRILNSTLQDTREANPSNVKYFKAEFNWSYPVSAGGVTTYVSSSSPIVSGVYKALDGYSLFPENVTQSLSSKSPFYPFLTDGPVSQSFFEDNTGTIGLFVGGGGNDILPTEVIYTNNLGSVAFLVTSSLNPTSSLCVAQIPAFPSQSGFVLGGPYTNYSIQAYSASVALGDAINFEVKCQQKYPNVRIKWKNRYGQFDYFNFDMVSRTSFSTQAKTYQPQIGSWQASQLTYESYETSNQKYVVDSKQSLTVNTDWVSEEYNDLFKQLLVSDEVYWMRSEADGGLLPITINTENVLFKTGVVDKVIQYQFDFLFGQGYKLIL